MKSTWRLPSIVWLMGQKTLQRQDRRGETSGIMSLCWDKFLTLRVREVYCIKKLPEDLLDQADRHLNNSTTRLWGSKCSEKSCKFSSVASFTKLWEQIGFLKAAWCNLFLYGSSPPPFGSHQPTCKPFPRGPGGLGGGFVKMKEEVQEREKSVNKVQIWK